MASIQGSCHSCNKPLVFLRWIAGRRVIVVGCEDCQEEVHFDLQRLIETLGDDELAGKFILPDDGRVH